MPNLGKVDFLFVINHKVKKEQILEIEKFFRNVDRQYLVTKTRDEAIEFVADADANNKFKIAVAVGGDGTVNAVVNGLMRNKNSKTFAVIPLGTGNDFAKSLNLPKTIEENCRLILSAQPRKIDVGKINELYFANIASIGIDALAAKFAENQSRVWKKISPFLHYAAGLLKAILKYRPIDFEIIGTYFIPQPEVEIKSGQKKKILLAAFANGKIYGGDFPIAPRAKIDDENLTLCVIESMPFWKTLRNLPKLLSAKHGELKEVFFADFKGIIVASNSGLLQLDGEIFQTKKTAENLYLYNIRVVPGALKAVRGGRAAEFVFSKNAKKTAAKKAANAAAFQKR